MTKVNMTLADRLMQKFTKPKMTALAELSSKGELSSFAGVFRVTPLSEQEQEALHNILDMHSVEGVDLADDLKNLATITTEVKAINNQAIILHGERIKKAQEILKKYKDGAFSAWLMATYGNRQTPYNFLQYYELYASLPQTLHPKVEEMPRQAIYTLASRTGEQEKKEEIIKNYNGQPKSELLALIRQTFPLADEDGRATDQAESALSALAKLHKLFDLSDFRPTSEQKKALEKSLRALLSLMQ